jgi:hypothetical protein
MKSPERAFDQRKSFRCAVPDSQQEAELRVRRRRFVVRLFNESSGGFAALTDRDLGVAAGDILTLVTRCDQYEVRVAHVTPIEPTPTEGDGAVFRLGLERLRELAALPEGQPAPGRFFARFYGRTLFPTSTVVIGGATVLVVAAILGAVAVLTNLNSPLVRKFALWQKGSSRSVPSPQGTLAQVVKEVGLSKRQQVQIQDVAQQTVDALQAIDALWKNDPPEVRSRKQALLLEAAKREIMRLLSEDQRARWKVLVE